ncbi:hypothetical protein RhiirC2_829910, partial [Rhizophagus irregularis]
LFFHLFFHFPSFFSCLISVYFILFICFIPLSVSFSSSVLFPSSFIHFVLIIFLFSSSIPFLSSSVHFFLSIIIICSIFSSSSFIPFSLSSSTPFLPSISLNFCFFFIPFCATLISVSLLFISFFFSTFV